jgi:glycine cleavage system H protein
MNIPAHLKYTKDHEWIAIEGNIATVGITDFAQRELGDIVFVDISTIGKPLQIGEVFGTVEAVKTVSDLFIPLSGTITEVNTHLDGTPDAVNSDPYETGWMIKMTITNEAEIATLLDAEAYTAVVG